MREEVVFDRLREMASIKISTSVNTLGKSITDLEDSL
jgi:hypothetical protein